MTIVDIMNENGTVATLRSDGGQAGFVVTHASISPTCPDGVVKENVLCPKYVMRLPLKSSISTPPL